MLRSDISRKKTMDIATGVGYPSHRGHESQWWKRFSGYWNYYRAFSAWLVFCSLVGSTYSDNIYLGNDQTTNILFSPHLLAAFIGFVLSSVNKNLSFLDALFLSVSATTSTGLATVSMSSLSPASFAVLAVLILLGGSLALPLAPLLYRRHVYQQMKSRYPPGICINDSPVLSEFELLDRSLGVMVTIIVSYIAGALVCGSMVLWGALHIGAEEPDLVARGYGRGSNAVFLTISAFNNAGYTLSSNSVTYLADNPVAYLTVALLIIAGNTMTPVFYRLIIFGELYYRKRLGLTHRTRELQFILDNPRKVSVNTLPTREVIFLLITTTTLNLVQYIFYLSSCLDRYQLRNEYGGQTTLAGIGFFQTISTRNAGLQIMNLRTMNQGMLLVYAIAMYLSGAPFVTALYASEDSSENKAKTTMTSTQDSEDVTTVTTLCSEEEEEEEEGSKIEMEDENGRVVDQDGCRNVVPGFYHLNNRKFEGSKGEEGVSKCEDTAGGTGDEESGNSCFHNLTASAEGAATIVVGVEPNTVLDLDSCSHGGALPAVVATSTEESAWAPEVVLKPSHSQSTESAMPSKPDAGRRPSSFGLVVDVLRSTGALEPTDQQVACTMDEEEKVRGSQDDDDSDDNDSNEDDITRETTGGQEVSEILPRKSSISSVDGNAGSRRSSGVMTVTFEDHRQRNDSEDIHALKSVGEAGAALGSISGRTITKEEPSTFMRIRRSSLTHLVDTMNLVAPPVMPSPHPSLSYMQINNSGNKHRPIEEADFHKLIRHNSVLLLNQKKFEIQHRFLETFIMKHSFFIGLGVFICAFSEDRLMVSHPDVLNVWYIIFEVISAYGNVGLSLTAPGQAFSLCGNFGTVGKLAIILVMLLGKHRGLPKEKDAVIDFKFRRLKRGLTAAKAQISDQNRLRLLEEGRFKWRKAHT